VNAIKENRWVHVAAVRNWNTGEIKFYVNGYLAVTQSFTQSEAYVN
jgi:hypothetical protein